MPQHVHIRWSRKIRGKLRSLGLRKFGIGVLAKTEQGLFVVDPRDFGVGRALLDRGFYHKDVIGFLSTRIDKQSTVVFVGAHIGALMVPLAKKTGRVIAFEPNPPTFEMLEANMHLNNLNNVSLFNLAASSVKEDLVMNHSPTNTGGSSVTRSKDTVGEVVNAVPLDDIIGDKKIDLMVVDAEGFEVQVFSGAQRVLHNTETLYTEYSPSMLRHQNATPQDFVDALKNHFRFMHYEIDDSTRYPVDEWIKSLLSLPPKGDWIVNLTFSKQ